MRREALSIPYHVFRFADLHEGLSVRWWSSVRDEVLAMAAAIPLLWADVGGPLANTVFASDA